MQLPDVIGLGGVIITLLAYFLLQIRKLRLEGVLYSVMNSLGSLMILSSLFFEWNLSAAIMESVWLMVSLYGLYKAVMSGLIRSRQ